MKTSIVKDKSYRFALEIIRFGRRLREEREYEIAGQLLRAGTSIGANVEEALVAVSRADFVAKMAIASKEARETNYWLRLLRDSKTLPAEVVSPMLERAEELLRMLTAIVKTIQTKKTTKNSKLRTKNYCPQGRVTVNVDPLSGSLSTWMVPPSSSVNCLTM